MSLKVFCAQWAQVYAVISDVTLYLVFWQWSLIFYSLPVNFCVVFYLLRIFGWNFLLCTSPEQNNLGLALGLNDLGVPQSQTAEDVTRS